MHRRYDLAGRSCLSNYEANKMPIDFKHRGSHRGSINISVCWYVPLSSSTVTQYGGMQSFVMRCQKGKIMSKHRAMGSIHAQGTNNLTSNIHKRQSNAEDDTKH